MRNVREQDCRPTVFACIITIVAMLQRRPAFHLGLFLLSAQYRTCERQRIL